MLVRHINRFCEHFAAMQNGVLSTTSLVIMGLKNLHPVTHDWKHIRTCVGSWNTHMLTYATMSHLNSHQRQFLVCSLISLVDLMWANVGISTLSPPSLLSAAAVAVDNEVPPHPEQGCVQITEAYSHEIIEAECIWRFR